MKRFASTEFTVGIFALVGLLIIIYMSLEVNDQGAVGAATRTHWAHFASVSGLIPRVRVEVSGIQVGFVETIELDGSKAKVTIRVRENIPVYQNAVLSMQDRGMLGDRFLMLDPGSPEYPALTDGGEIKKTYSRSDLDNVLTSLGETAEMLRDLVKADDPQGAMGQTIVNLRNMTEKLDAIVGDSHGQIERILTNFDSFSEDLSDISSENKDQIHDVLVGLQDVSVSLQSALGEGGSIEVATRRLDETMASVQRIVEKIERGEGTIGKLVNDEETIDNLNETISNVNDTLGTYRRIRLGIRYRGEYLTQAKDLQNLIAISLSPSPDKFVMLEFVDAAVGETKKTDTIIRGPDGTVISQTETVQTNDSILISFILGKRFWDATFRFGLIRNKGGVGIDYHLLSDKLTLSFEAFDFSRADNNPHLRSYATLTLYKHLLLTGGVDDIASDGDINPFFGAGIQFTDDDLKALATAGASSF